VIVGSRIPTHLSSRSYMASGEAQSAPRAWERMVSVYQSGNRAQLPLSIASVVPRARDLDSARLDHANGAHTAREILVVAMDAAQVREVDVHRHVGRLL